MMWLGMWLSVLCECGLNENMLVYQAAQKYGCSTESRLSGWVDIGKGKFCIRNPSRAVLAVL